MSKPLRHVLVVVAVVYDKARGFFLCFNRRWGGYAFPMKKPQPGRTLEQVAVQAVVDHFGPAAAGGSAKPLEFVGDFTYSLGVGELTYYDYHVFEVDPGTPLPPGSFTSWAGFLPYNDLLPSPTVTQSTKDIARALVDFQEVAAAVIARIRPSGPEVLLVWNDGYGGYFLPVARRKTEALPETFAIEAVQSDTGYTGPIDPQWCGEVETRHYSARYGRDRCFRFHFYAVRLPDVPLDQPGNALEASLQAKAIERGRPADYWAWVPASQLLTWPRVSPTMGEVALQVRRCAGA